METVCWQRGDKEPCRAPRSRRSSACAVSEACRVDGAWVAGVHRVSQVAFIVGWLRKGMEVMSACGPVALRRRLGRLLGAIVCTGSPLFAAALLAFAGARKIASAVPTWWLSREPKLLFDLFLGVGELFAATAAVAYLRWGRIALLLIYAAYAATSGVWWLLGNEHCGCYGSTAWSSGHVAATDTLIAIVLLVCCRRPVANGSLGAALARLLGLAGLTSMLWVVLSAGAFHRLDVELMDVRRLVGATAPLRVRAPHRLAKFRGRWLLVLADPRCARCVEVVSTLARGDSLDGLVHCWPQHQSKPADQLFSVAVAWLGEWTAAPEIGSRQSSRQWVVLRGGEFDSVGLTNPPVLLWLEDGRVVRVCCPARVGACYIRKVRSARISLRLISAEKGGKLRARAFGIGSRPPHTDGAHVGRPRCRA